VLKEALNMDKKGDEDFVMLRNLWRRGNMEGVEQMIKERGSNKEVVWSVIYYNV
jgi:hypothetical protein